MIALPIQIVIALILDALFGDPRWLPHPVQGIGKLALALEKPLRRHLSNERIAGILLVILTVGTTALSCHLLLFISSDVHPLFGDLVAILILYTCLAARDLSHHASAVKQALVREDLADARGHVALLVGRDTKNLDEAGISRATIESVAENTVDAVTAPLLFAFLAGPVGAMVYKAINTLDSMFGYKNDRYLYFGWASARLDDVANFIPARLSALLVPLSAACLKLDARQAWKIWLRDRNNHPSPNAGQIEAAMAGALNVRLGGENSYFGKSTLRPYMGEPKQQLCARHISETIDLMWTTSLLTGVLGMAYWFGTGLFNSQGGSLG
jgi:adenosylcobinamide-phosphate synthase